MRTAGIDIGSRSIELVVVDDGRITTSKVSESGIDPLRRAMTLLEGVEYDRLVATGYSRNLIKTSHHAITITEIKAYAIGTHFLFPGARTVLDIGGQDFKIIALDERGKVIKFEMNDRCAAGTGRFLEVMGHALGFSIDEFGNAALSTEEECTINSMCTVFAESEVISLTARGADSRAIARGLHRSVVRRIISMIHRVSVQEPFIFAGGVAQNPCIRVLLEQELRIPVLVPDQPYMVGALGAALC